MVKIQMGQIVNAVGLKGEVKVYPYCQAKERFAELKFVYAGETKRNIEKVRYHKNLAILKLEGIDDRTAAEGQKGLAVFMPETELKELPEGSYYIRDMIGLSVVDESKALIGYLSQVVQNSAQDLYEVEMEDGKKIWIPAVEEFILNIDMKGGTITVKLIEGMVE